MMMKGLSPYSLSTILAIGVVLLAVTNAVVWYIVVVEESREYLTVTYLDQGQADATLIEAPNGNRVLIDAGRGPKVVEALSEHLPFYDPTIDVLITTHPHADHIGGVAMLLDHFDVDLILDPGATHDSTVFSSYQSAVEESGAELFYARRGMVISLGSGVEIPILFPTHNTETLEPDTASIWSQVIYGDTRFLFTGDAFTDVERYMVQQDGARLESDVFQAGHHGSNTSNDLGFLITLQPEYVVISAGEDNRHGHPHEEVVERIRYIGAEMPATYEEGDIIFVSDGEQIVISQPAYRR